MDTHRLREYCCTRDDAGAPEILPAGRNVERRPDDGTQRIIVLP